MCTRRIPMVSSLAAAISDVGLDAADHALDCEHRPRLHYVALAHTGASVGCAPWLGHAAGIWMRGDDRCHHLGATNHSTGRAAMRDRQPAVVHATALPKRVMSLVNVRGSKNLPHRVMPVVRRICETGRRRTTCQDMILRHRQRTTAEAFTHAIGRNKLKIKSHKRRTQ